VIGALLDREHPAQPHFVQEQVSLVGEHDA
jgi:hypothetical protein